MILALGIAAALLRSVLPAAAAALILCWLWRIHEEKWHIIILILVFIFGLFRTQIRLELKQAEAQQLSEASCVTVTGRVLRKETKNEQVLYHLKSSSCTVQGQTLRCRHLLVYLDAPQFPVDSVITVTGTPKLPEQARNFGNFDQQTYYSGLNVDFIVYGKDVLSAKMPLISPENTLDTLKQRLKAAFFSYTDPKTAGILSTMILGEKQDLDEEVKSLYQSAGISHILAISGLHVSMIGMMLYQALRKRKVRFLPAGIAAGTVIFLYTRLSGMSPSAFRAMVMFLCMLLAPVVKRSYDSLSAMGLSAILLLVYNPEVLLYTGFVFSYAAVIAVVVVGGALNRRSTEKKKKKQKILDLFRTCYAVQLMTIPIVLSVYYEVPLYALLLNMLVLPLAGFALVPGLLGGILGCLATYGAAFLEIPAKIILLIPKLILFAYEKLCGFFLQLPFARIVTGKPAFFLVAGYFLILGVSVFLLKKHRLFSLLPLPALLLLMVLSGQHGFFLSMLDVGQGDGIYIQTAKGNSVMIDGGSSDQKQVGKYRVLPFLKACGEGEVDYWIVSHTDQDHISALEEALDSGYKIYNLILAKYIYEDEVSEKLRVKAEETGCTVHTLSPGQCLTFGALRLTCLFPDASYTVEDKNARSLVLELSYRDFSAILTGDIGAEEERLMTERGLLHDVDFYKVSHHGSAYSSDPAFLEAIRPELAGISCAMKNRYGHPAEETVDRIRAVGAEVLETRFCGEIRLTLSGEKIHVEKRISP